MTPDRFRACLQSIGWTQRGLADRLGIHETRVRRWASGQYEIPAEIMAWLERLADTHGRHPLPDGWGTVVSGRWSGASKAPLLTTGR